MDKQKLILKALVEKFNEKVVIVEFYDQLLGSTFQRRCLVLDKVICQITATEGISISPIFFFVVGVIPVSKLYEAAVVRSMQPVNTPNEQEKIIIEAFKQGKTTCEVKVSINIKR